MLWETFFNVAIMKVRFFVYEFWPLKLMTDLNPRPVSWPGTVWSRGLCATASHQYFFPSSWPRKSWSLGEERTETSVSDVAGSAGAEAAFSLGFSAELRFNRRILHRVKGSTSLPKCDNVPLPMLDARWFLTSVDHVPKGVWCLIHLLVGLQH